MNHLALIENDDTRVLVILLLDLILGVYTLPLDLALIKYKNTITISTVSSLQYVTWWRETDCAKQSLKESFKNDRIDRLYHPIG